ncbi:YcjX family protein [Klebsiella pneumoniae]|nr:YcjX family protein [Klebsiella pneumoniae]
MRWSTAGLDRHLRLAVTGLSRSGKTAFITAPGQPAVQYPHRRPPAAAERRTRRAAARRQARAAAGLWHSPIHL